MENISTNESKRLSKLSASPKILKMIMIFSIFLFVIVISLYIYTQCEKDKVAAGTCINIGDKQFQYIENLTYDQAVEKLHEVINQYLHSTITLTDSSTMLKPTLMDLGVSIETEPAVNYIKNSLYGPYMYDSLIKHLNNNLRIPAVSGIKIDREKLDNYINSNLRFIDNAPEDAKLFINSNGEMEVRKDISGRALDKNKLNAQIVSAAMSDNLNISIPTIEIKAKVTETDIRNVMPVKQISIFSSYYGGSDSGRKENVRVGASRINNILLKPGEEFEYWKYVGEPTAAAGFKPAGIFLNGKVAVGIGGGLCQVSTTLYNAALLADLQITGRTPHGMPVHYVPLGLDATVAYGALTLKFVNNTGKYILIKSNTDKNRITFSIYGEMPAEKTVKVYSKIVGDNIADAYRNVYLNGELERHDYLGRSAYKTPATSE